MQLDDRATEACAPPDRPGIDAGPWMAFPLSGRRSCLPEPRDGAWRPLVRHWETRGSAPGAETAWACVHWAPAGLLYTVMLPGDSPANRARRLNERTWELGDVCEFFIQPRGSDAYLEAHVTPENHRLQLWWPADGLSRVRSGLCALENFMVGEPDWVESHVDFTATGWRATLFVPAARLGLKQLQARDTVRTAVCRYHYGNDSLHPTLSSTARLRAGAFHCPAEWDELQLTL